MRFISRRLGVGIALGCAAVGVAALSLVSHTGSNALAGQLYPLFIGSGNVNYISYGTVQFAGPNDSPTLVTVSLENVRPNSTYSVRECQGMLDGSVNCVGGSDNVKTDATGSGQGTIVFTSPAEVDNVIVTNQANGSDFFIAATNANAFTSGGGGVAFPAPTMFGVPMFGGPVIGVAVISVAGY